MHAFLDITQSASFKTVDLQLHVQPKSSQIYQTAGPNLDHPTSVWKQQTTSKETTNKQTKKDENTD